MKSIVAMLAVATVSAQIKIHTKIWADEIKFEILNDDGDILCSGGPYKDNGTTYTAACKIDPKVKDLTLKCIDTYGDGWHGGSLQFLGNIYCEDFTRGSLKTVRLHNPWNDASAEAHQHGGSQAH